MTVNKLHKYLSKLIAEGHGRKPVTVNKRSFYNPLEADGAVILDVHDAEYRWVNWVDDDGGTKENADGSESGRRCVILLGDHDFDDGGAE